MQSCLRVYGKGIFKKNKTDDKNELSQTNLFLLILFLREKKERKNGIMRQRFYLLQSN